MVIGLLVWKRRMNKLFHYLLFSDPAGVVHSPWRFCDELMAPYDRLKMMAHCHIFEDDDPQGNGPIAEDKFTRVLERGDNDGRLPRDCWAFLNIENDGHNPHRSLGHPPWLETNQEGLDFFHGALDLVQRVRPDVTWGIYGRVPWTDYQGMLSPNAQDGIEQVLFDCRHLARRLHCPPHMGYLMPYFDDKVSFNGWEPATGTPFENRLEWIRKTLDYTRRYYPESTVIPMLRMEYMDLWRARPDPDTAEHQKARRLGGYKWLRYCELILKMADGICIVGGEGGTPFDFDADWWLAMKKMFELYRSPRSAVS